MGCICTKVTPPTEQAEIQREKSPTSGSRRFVTPPRKVEVIVSGRHSVSRVDCGVRTIPKRQESFVVTHPPLAVDNKVVVPVEKKVVVDVLPQRKDSGHRQCPTFDIGPKEAMPDVRITHIPNAFEAEHVAAGWPSWLASVAGEAIEGWVPRKASSFERLYKIGQGTYSNVYKARDLDTGMVVALKKVRFINMDPDSVRFMAREIHVLRKLNHPNIVKLECLITSRTSRSLYLVFEYMEHDLAGLAASANIQFTEAQIKCYMKQLLCGLDYCHSHGVMHRDIKGANLLIDSSGLLKLADFGLATVFNPEKRQPLTSHVVTLWYRPPELLLGATNYNFTVDLWSSGCILAELLAGKPIMPGRTEVEQLHKIFKLCGSPSEEYWRKSKLPHATVFKPQHPYRRCVMDTFKNFPSSALALLDCLLAVEPEHRGTASDALNSDFFTTKPYACDPLALPKYPPSKEFDAKLREEEAARKKEPAAKGLGSQSVRKGPGEYKAPEAYAEHGTPLQKRQAKSNPRSNSISENYNTTDDVVSGFLIDAPKQKMLNKITYSGPFIHLRTFEHSQRNSGKLNGTRLKGHQSYMPSAGGGDLPNLPGLGVQRSSIRSDINRDRNMQPHWQEQTSRFNQLGDPAASQKQDWSPSSSQKDEIIGPREPTSGYDAKKNRIHYSGPLMPPSGNMEEMLKEHERHIQQAVRKARFEKAMSRKNPGEKGHFAAVLFRGTDGNLNV